MKDFIKVTSLEHALQLNGETIEQFNHRTQFDDDVQRAGKELEVIAYAINRGRSMKLRERRYHPVFVRFGACLAFNYSGCYYSFSNVNARHTVISMEASDYFGEQHVSIWQRYMEGV